MKRLESCFFTVAAVLLIIVLSIFLFFKRFEYTSPVNEAGREYQKNIETYQNKDIETIEDVYERLEVLDSHFDSPTFDKMQGGELVEITPSDIEILFGKPDRIHENVEMSFAHTVYQYDYENLTINFHEDYRGISEYVIEDYHATFYTTEDLDRLFFGAIKNQQKEFDQINDELEPITLEKATEGIMDGSPTREIMDNGWSTHTYSPLPIQYFDDGSGEYAPEEYLLLRFRKEKEDVLLYSMQRRYKETYERLDSIEEAKQKDEAYDDFKMIIDEEEANDTNERITVGDLLNAFGDIARFDYDFQNGLLQIVWLKNDEFEKEFFTKMSSENISDIENLNDLEVNNLEFKRIHPTDRPYRTDEFIGSK